jgi:hypothetical protein
MVNIPKRTKGKLKADLGCKKMYKYYLKNIKSVESIAGGETTGSYKLTQKEYTSILKDINKKITEVIIKENFEYKIPCNLGTISMKQSKVNYELDEKGELVVSNLSIDFKATKDLWNNDEESARLKRVVYHTNEHTNGNRMAYWWKKSKKCPFGMRPYYFLPCREMKRTPARLLKDENLSLMFFEQSTKHKDNIRIFKNKNKV